MDYTVIRQKRKTASITINEHLEVCIKVPNRMTDQEVVRMVTKHEEWIEKALEEKRKRIETMDWYYTGRMCYQGQYYEVQLKKTNFKPRVRFVNKAFYVDYDGKEEVARCAMEQFFRQVAKEKLAMMASDYAKALGVSYQKITIRNQTTRWGSCSSKGNLSFNLKILCAPPKMMAYVVLHEVAHLKHFNHSVDFWKEIERWMPDYKECVHYFNQFGQNFII